MKKSGKKLVLHKETLRNLASGRLEVIVGGLSTACTGGCAETVYSCDATCTCSDDCTSPRHSCIC